jgi:hypothetical protein
MGPEGEKFWSYGFSIPQGGWSWGKIDPIADPEAGLTDEEFLELAHAAMSLFEMTALDIELAEMDELEAEVQANDCSEAARMIQEVMQKKA